jgi:NADH-quinone oxidoreductase subunit N
MFMFNSSVASIDHGYLFIDSVFVSFCKLFVLGTLLIIIIAMQPKLSKEKSLIPDFIFLLNLLVLLVLFIFILLSSYDFVVAYLALEGISLILYILGGFLKENLISLESIIKYFLLNSLSSSIMLFSVSLMFGVLGALDFLEIQYILASNFKDFINNDFYIICLLSCFGFFFKLGFFPFH